MVKEIKILFKIFTGFSRRSRNLLLNAGVLTYAKFSLGRFSIDGEGGSIQRYSLIMRVYYVEVLYHRNKC